MSWFDGKARAVLLGRDSTVDDAAARIEDGGGRRLVICGRAGVGKTAVAREISDRLDHDRVFVPAAGATDVQEMFVRLGRAVGTTGAGRGIRSAITYELGRRPTVLVLDGCESWEAVDPVVDDLLGRCGDLVALLTARFPPDRSDDAVIHLRPLPVPDPDEHDVAALRQNPAVRMFVERSQQLSAAFEPTAADVRAVAELCRRLDGVPLAISLAASRTQLMDPQAMLSEMGRIGAWRLVGMTLDDEFASTFEQLDEAGRRTFAALEVFIGGATVDALHAVTGLPRLADTLDALTGLVNLDLVDVDRSRARYALASAASTFAKQHFEDGRRDELRARHAEHFAASARQGTDPDGDAVPDHDLAIDHGNRMAAVSWWRETGEFDRALRLLVDTAPDFDRRGEPETGRLLLVGALEAAPGAPARTKAECHLWIARFTAESADASLRTAAIEHLRAARDLAVESGHEPTIFLALNAICENHTLLGVFELAREAVAEGLERARDDRHPVAEVSLLTWHAVLTHQDGDAAGAADVLGTAVRKAMALGNRRLIVRTCLVLLGLPPDVRAGVAPDMPAPQQLVEMARAEGDHRGEGWLLAVVTGVALDDDDPKRAAASARQLLQLSGRTANPPLGRLALTAAVRLAVRQGDAKIAARIAGALDRHAATVEASTPPHHYTALRRAIDTAEDDLGAEAFAEEHERGRLDRWSDLMALADAFLQSLVEPLEALDGDPAPLVNALSPREMDVLAELAAGRSNKEIAAELGMRPKTVMHHCAAIYRKLDVPGRGAAVAVALRTGVISS